MFFCCLSKNSDSSSNQDKNESKFGEMTKEEKEKHIKELWTKARRYCNKLRFQSRLQKMTESNINKMMIDDINEEALQETNVQENEIKLKWYLIDSERVFCRVWDFMITLLIFYNLIVSPFVVVFPTVYQWCETHNENDEIIEKSAIGCTDKIISNESLKSIELAIDCIFLIEIMMNFLKRSMAYPTLPLIAHHYITGQFLFDVIATVPNLIMDEKIDFYILKFFRIIHVARIQQPLELVLGYALQNSSKKRQGDMISFACLILFVIYVCHLSACFWLFLGRMSSCVDDEGAEILLCVKSWVYANDFEGKPNST